MGPLKRLPAVLRGLDPQDRKVIGEAIKDGEFAWPIGMPLVRSLGHGLWEVRCILAQGRMARVLFGVDVSKMILLHAFVKKTQKTPRSDMELAIRRMNGGLR